MRPVPIWPRASPLGWTLMLLAIVMLVMSRVAEWLEPAFGLSVVGLIVAADIAVLVVSGCAAAVELGLVPGLRRLWRRLAGDRERFVNGLAAFSVLVLLVVAIAYRHSGTPVDAWLAVAGAVLLPIGGALALRPRGSRASPPTSG
jgi:hypothetical protein